MLANAASLLNLDVTILDVGDRAPAKQVYAPSPPKQHIDGSFTDPEKILQLAARVDVLTVEIEHVDAAVLEKIEKSSRIEVHPTSQTLRMIQDKFVQKEHLKASSLPVADYLQVESTPEALAAASETLGLPLMLKSRHLAYDGRGNFALYSISQAKEAIAALGNRPLYAEKWASFTKEIAVMVVRGANGAIKSYPAVETVHKDNICHLVFAPLRESNPEVAATARRIAEEAVMTFTGAGVFGVELFLMPDGRILINEIAPRPHNSGHYTIEACYTSQYENHLRAILSLPLGSTALKVPSAVMLNLIGVSNNIEEIKHVARVALSVPGASVHLYGKTDCRKGRKMGHITLVGSSDADTRENLRPLLEALPGATPSSVEAGIRVIIAGAGGAAHLPGMVAALTSLPVIGVPVKGSVLDGVDSLYSIVQMPRGIPVATVAINNSTNAGLLAVRILGSATESTREDMDKYLLKLEGEVLVKVDKLEEVGWENYVVQR
ncbi:hypothetical protein BS47DRAFT_1351910 [Hydnum rufescens UP504]|uniref:Phosphoribosylaminoimidazole carboxylase n=1 Tax=Hydnum rufescens UP504 TaxID=1448309 RepID=A0A9P6AK24_9AGAM|nr:hypothetical protein BS47DRAFT_1351910 [Hydnum rufescens UP504]